MLTNVDMLQLAVIQLINLFSFESIINPITTSLGVISLAAVVLVLAPSNKEEINEESHDVNITRESRRVVKELASSIKGTLMNYNSYISNGILGVSELNQFLHDKDSIYIRTISNHSIEIGIQSKYREGLNWYYDKQKILLLNIELLENKASIVCRDKNGVFIRRISLNNIYLERFVKDDQFDYRFYTKEIYRYAYPHLISLLFTVQGLKRKVVEQPNPTTTENQIKQAA